MDFGHPAPEKNNLEPPWLLVSLRGALPHPGPGPAQSMRRMGALRVWRQGKRVLGLWGDDQTSRKAISELSKDFPGAELRVRGFNASDPKTVWQSPWPEWEGPGLKLYPSWTGVKPDEHTLVIDPLAAFGAGDHPSTGLNLTLLAGLAQEGWRPGPGEWLADVGAGTGVLALALALLFKEKVLAIDPDPFSARAWSRNRALNPLASALVYFVRGTHASLAGPFALAAANLPGPLLMQVASCLSAILTPGGMLAISGFRCEQTPPIRHRFLELGLRPVDSCQEAGWEGLLLCRD
ncbi:MAG: 50S ribosomal protein L11 methyltransferase [Desulfarculaceae bacterium]|jgi:ribosomal protein L11 methyltransferase